MNIYKIIFKIVLFYNLGMGTSYDMQVLEDIGKTRRIQSAPCTPLVLLFYLV